MILKWKVSRMTDHLSVMLWIIRRMVNLWQQRAKLDVLVWSGILTIYMIIVIMRIFHYERTGVRNSGQRIDLPRFGVLVSVGIFIMRLFCRGVISWIRYVYVYLMEKPVRKSSSLGKLFPCLNIIRMKDTGCVVVLIWRDWGMKIWNGRWLPNIMLDWNLLFWIIELRVILIITRKRRIICFLWWIYRILQVFLLIWKILEWWRIRATKVR